MKVVLYILSLSMLTCSCKLLKPVSSVESSTTIKDTTVVTELRVIDTFMYIPDFEMYDSIGYLNTVTKEDENAKITLTQKGKTVSAKADCKPTKIVVPKVIRQTIKETKEGSQFEKYLKYFLIMWGIIEAIKILKK